MPVGGCQLRRIGWISLLARYRRPPSLLRSSFGLLHHQPCSPDRRYRFPGPRKACSTSGTVHCRACNHLFLQKAVQRPLKRGELVLHSHLPAQRLPLALQLAVDAQTPTSSTGSAVGLKDALDLGLAAAEAGLGAFGFLGIVHVVAAALSWRAGGVAPHGWLRACRMRRC